MDELVTVRFSILECDGAMLTLARSQAPALGEQLTHAKNRCDISRPQVAVEWSHGTVRQRT